jgi:diadenylate cyclase
MKPLDVAIAVVDIAIVAYVVYRLLVLIRGTRAVQLIKGIIVVLVATLLSDRLNLVTVNWVLQKTLVMLVVALPIVFQPELRRALEQLGRAGFLARTLKSLGEQDVGRLVNEVVRATTILSRNRTGAIMVIERDTGLREIVETGIKVDAEVSGELLVNLFIPHTPLHDGAVVVRGNRIAAAACFLPLAESSEVGRELGSRHRAAVGITEHSDALAVVVSEETGAVSLANAGKLMRGLDEEMLRELLTSLLRARPKGAAGGPGVGGPGVGGPGVGGPGGDGDTRQVGER